MDETLEAQQSGGIAVSEKADYARLRELAVAAVEGDERALNPGAWEAFFSMHGDPYVVEQGRGLFGVVATVAPSPDDYGRARAEYLAAVNPQVIGGVLDEVKRLRSIDQVVAHYLRELPARLACIDAAFSHTATGDGHASSVELDELYALRRWAESLARAVENRRNPDA
jgi:hypothetical protein